jgi:hypothetical protein
MRRGGAEHAAWPVRQLPGARRRQLIETGAAAVGSGAARGRRLAPDSARNGVPARRRRRCRPAVVKELTVKAKIIQDAEVVTYVVVCDPGEEAVAALTQFARTERLEASQMTAVGAFERATVGWFDRAAKHYRRIPVDEQC